MKGYVHSQESFGTVDGPGIRYVVFVQGCPMRCQYCHNPDTWTPAIGQMMDTDEILAAYERNRVYYQNGGLTVTGGEPLLQIEFVTELFEKAKAKDIHTCLDTSGITFQPDNPTRMEAFDRLMQSTDLTPWALPNTSSWALIIRCRVSRPWTKPGFPSCGPKSSGE